MAGKKGAISLSIISIPFPSSLISLFILFSPYLHSNASPFKTSREANEGEKEWI